MPWSKKFPEICFTNAKVLRVREIILFSIPEEPGYIVEMT